MLRNYLRVALRSLTRQKGYTLLNMLGLAVGLAGCLIMFSYVRADLQWDGFHANGDRIYRLNQRQSFGGVEPQLVAYTATPIAPVIQQELAGVEQAVRFFPGWGALTVGEGDQAQYEEHAAYADSSFFQVFSYPVLRGNPSTMLARPDAIVLSEEVATKYFGDSDPMGKTLRLFNKRDAVVTGVLGPNPEGTHLDFNILLPFDAAFDDYPQFSEGRDSWGSNSLATYLLLAPGVTRDQMDAQLPDFFARHRNMDGIEYYLQPLADLHLYADDVKYQINNQPSSVADVLTLGTIGAFLLLIAVINYMNLATARSIRRAREVGLRKVVGARRSNLVAQFLGESVLLSLLSMGIAVLIIELAKPLFEEIAGRTVAFNVLDGGFGSAATLGLTLLVGLVAGLYPAFVLSSFRPVAVLKGRLDSGRRGSWFRRTLVILQFGASIVLIIATILVYRQISYTRSIKLGYDRKHVISVRLRDPEVQQHASTLRDRFAALTGVEDASLSEALPVTGTGQTSVEPEGTGDSWLVSYYFCDPHQAKVMDFKVAQGRFLSEDYPNDVVQFDDSTSGAVVINQTAANKLGWADPIGKRINVWQRSLPVVGVIEDFHYTSLRQVIEPMMIAQLGRPGRYVSVRYNRGDVSSLLADMEGIWKETAGEAPFQYFFVDERYDRMYRADVRFGNVLRLFSGLTVFIASLGLLGLASYATQRRTREIGVRKVLGASEGQILVLVSREFALLVVGATLIAWPVAWYVVRDWLGHFAYRAPLAWWAFPLAGVGALLVALGTIGLQAWRAANTNPVQALRQE